MEMGCGVVEIWFSSDWHDGHDNIIRYANRPFSNVMEMRAFMIARHNEYVRPSDHYYNLGDLTMARDNRGMGLAFLTRMNGHKRLVMGNHDHYHVKHYMQYFEKVMAMQRIDRLFLKEWEDNGKACRRVVPYVNISVEATNYHPVNLEWLRKEAERLKEEYLEDLCVLLPAREAGVRPSRS